MYNSKSKKEQVTIFWVSIGHTRCGNSLIFKQEELPQCTTCQIPYSVKYFLIGCRDLALTLDIFFNANSMK